MAILGALVLASALLFFVYVLVQFRLEEVRSRNKVSAPVIWIMPVRSAADGQQNARSAEGWSPRPVTCITAAQPRGEEDLAGYLTSRIAVLPSQTGRLAAKRVAKG